MVKVTNEKSRWTSESFTVRSADNWEWMSVDVKCDGQSIDLKINSSFVSMAYYWNHCGTNVEWRDWLLGVNYTYFMDKMFGSKARVFSMTHTRETIASAIEEMLEDPDELDSRLEILHDSCEYWSHESEAFEWLSTYWDWVGDDYHELVKDEPRPELVNFWNVLWRPFIETVSADPS